ncbi:MAG: hypothetical protein QNJ12_04355 [Ilumatobacter sp.]|uniref:hypothetical protein n=1 Tax=Ilumatobacter sp. TaxID=1967498 RepID=UPI0026161A65|nr:hypothetical protein [Ilumatobacter sp.]MDJ0767997.1 hypothetical protein [Ilumatobacter sp.]
MVASLVLLFAFTAGAVVWLARDVDRTISNRSIAASVAFQAARSGAQQVEVGSLRGGADDEITIDEDRARAEVQRVATRLLGEYGVTGTASARIGGADPLLVTVTVVITDPVGDVTGVGSARPETGP